jgi:hypothetical protein
MNIIVDAAFEGSILALLKVTFGWRQSGCLHFGGKESNNDLRDTLRIPKFVRHPATQYRPNHA